MPNQEKSSVVVVMVPLLAQGHLNQLLQLSRIILSYGLPVHYIAPATHNRQATLRAHGWDPVAAANLHFHDCQIPPFHSPPPNPNATLKFPSHLQPCFNATSHLREPVAQLLRSLSSQARKLVVIHDSLMRPAVQDVGSIPNAENYCFDSVGAFTTFFFYWESIGKPKVNPEVELLDQQGNVPSVEGCFSDEFIEYAVSLRQYLNVQTDGHICNSNRAIEIEGKCMDLLETMKGKKHWALGPLNPVRITTDQRQRHRCLEWLDKQAENSVLYISFGSTTAMDDDQIKELAIGLRRSNQKFVWVLRDADKADVFDEGGEVRRPKLPQGYEDSIKDMGLVVREWAPQLEILAHPATGGFMSHCGWNSCMESMSMGVPIAAWPMHSDQPRNAALITKLLRVGITVKDWGRWEEIVNASTVEEGVKHLMASKEGDEVRRRAAELGGAMRQTMAEGQVSSKEWDSFITHITS